MKENSTERIVFYFTILCTFVKAKKEKQNSEARNKKISEAKK